MAPRPDKTVFEKQPDDKGADSRKKELEHQRYIERFKASIPDESAKRHKAEEQRLLLRERHARGMSQERWDHYLRTHDGKTPDEVEGTGRYRPRKPVVPQPKPLAPPKHVITPWHAPVHDHLVHGPLPGSAALTNHIVMHHDPEPPVYEDSAPAFIPPKGGQPKMAPKD